MGNKIIKLHGCSGAGKTTVARAVLAGAHQVNIVTTDRSKHEAYVCDYKGYDRPIVVLGSYQNNCGGMDTVPAAADAVKLVKFYHDVGHVLHEGLLQSTYYGAMGDDSKQYGDDYIYAFMDTPLLTCLERVTRRRDMMKSKNKFDPQLTTDKFNTIQRLNLRVAAMGHRVVAFRHLDDPVGQIHTILKDAA